MLTAQQRTERTSGIGSSDIPILLGEYAKYGKDAEWLFLTKTGQIPPEDENEAMRWGTLMEPVIIGEFERRTYWSVANEDLETFRFPGSPWAMAHPDGILYHNGDEYGLLEVKNSRYYNEKQGPRDAYLMQLQWQLGVCGYDTGVIAVLEAGQQLHWTEHSLDMPVFRKLFDLASAFWSRVEAYRNQ